MKKTVLGLLLAFTCCHLTTTYAVDFSKITYKQIKKSEKIWGIDLSHHQSKVDWEKLQQQKPYFIFLKATEGATHTDRLYNSNYKNARKSGILVGSYHFFSYRSSGKMQAVHFIRIANYKLGDLPLVLDAEYINNMPPRKTVTKELISFLNTVKKKTGKFPIIYCDYDYYKEYLKNEITTDFPLWICDYKNEPDCNWTFWQTTDAFMLEGVRGKIDFNLFNGSLKELKRLTRK